MSQGLLVRASRRGASKKCHAASPHKPRKWAASPHRQVPPVAQIYVGNDNDVYLQGYRLAATGAPVTDALPAFTVYYDNGLTPIHGLTGVTMPYTGANGDYRGLIPGTASVMQDIQGAIQGAITGGTLVGLSTSNVVIQKVPSDRNQSLPCVVIAPQGEELETTGVNDRDDITYNVVVALVNNDNQDQSANYEQELNWRQNIRRLFHMKQLGPLTIESVKTFVKPLETVDREAWYANLLKSAMLVQATCREVRTQG
jgi:hypothetical protein